jgi:aryl-alcohol dehydrogenase-like predicted oxidoreductase
LDERFWGRSDKGEHIAAMRRAFELGINFFDTADGYGNGRSESVMGEALSVLPRDEIVITTKVYHNFHEIQGRRVDIGDLSCDGVISHCEASLRRLRTDYIDIYLCHSFDMMTPIEETTRAMEDLKRQGRIRHYGISNFSAEQMRLALKCGGYEVVQPRFSFFMPDSEKDILPLARAEGLAVMTYSPLYRGLLSGKYSGEEVFTEGVKSRSGYFKGETFSELCARVRRLQPIADKYGLTIAQLVYAAILRNPAIHSVIVGVSKTEHIKEAAGAMGIEISREDYYVLRRVLGKLPTA